MKVCSRRDVPSIAMHRTTFSPKCCCKRVRNVCDGVVAEYRAYGDFEGELLVTVHGGKGVQNSGKLLGSELDYIHPSAVVPSSFVRAWSLQWLRVASDSSRGKGFLRTIDDGTNDLVDLSILGRVGACESLAKSWCKGRLDRLEGAS